MSPAQAAAAKAAVLGYSTVTAKGHAEYGTVRQGDLDKCFKDAELLLEMPDDTYVNGIRHDVVGVSKYLGKQCYDPTGQDPGQDRAFFSRATMDVTEHISYHALLQ